MQFSDFFKEELIFTMKWHLGIRWGSLLELRNKWCFSIFKSTKRIIIEGFLTTHRLLKSGRSLKRTRKRQLKLRKLSQKLKRSKKSKSLKLKFQNPKQLRKIRQKLTSSFSISRLTMEMILGNINGASLSMRSLYKLIFQLKGSRAKM